MATRPVRGRRRARPGASGLRAYEALRTLILDGRYAPGARLKEVEVAALLGVSRTPVREALLQLEVEGMVELIPRRGAMVRGLTRADVHEIFVLRAVLEAFCASEAAVRMDDASIEHLAELHDEFELGVERWRGDEQAEALVELNTDFHRAVIAGGGNARIAAVLDKLTAVPQAWKCGFWSSRRQRETAVVYHREIVDAVRARDPLRADAVMKSHIYAAKDYFTDQLRRGDDAR
jgi:DNA-binding GntR family transcriptional regulator